MRRMKRGRMCKQQKRWLGCSYATPTHSQRNTKRGGQGDFNCTHAHRTQCARGRRGVATWTPRMQGEPRAQVATAAGAVHGPCATDPRPLCPWGQTVCNTTVCTHAPRFAARASGWHAPHQGHRGSCGAPAPSACHYSQHATGSTRRQSLCGRPCAVETRVPCRQRCAAAWFAAHPTSCRLCGALRSCSGLGKNTAIQA